MIWFHWISTRQRTGIQGKAQAKPEVIFDHQFVALIHAHGGRLDNFRAAPLQLRVQGIEIVHPNVSIKADAAPRNVRRGQSSVIGLSKVNYNVIAGDHSEHGRIEGITQDLEAQKAAIVFSLSNDIRNYKARTNSFALPF